MNNLLNYNLLNYVYLNSITVKLTIKQFLYFGLHLGHLKKNTQFLTAWLFYGWRKNIFIINLIKTVFLLKIGLKMIKNVIKLRLTFLFTSMNKIFGPYLARYALLCNESFNIYYWISGSLSNFRYVMSWYSLLFNLYRKNLYKVRHMDKKKLSSYYGYRPYSLLNFNPNKSKNEVKKIKKSKWIDIIGFNSKEFQSKLDIYLQNNKFLNKKSKSKFNIKKLNKSWRYSKFSGIFKHKHIAQRYLDNIDKLKKNVIWNLYNKLYDKIFINNDNNDDEFITWLKLKFKGREIFFRKLSGNSKFFLSIFKELNSFVNYYKKNNKYKKKYGKWNKKEYKDLLDNYRSLALKFKTSKNFFYNFILDLKNQKQLIFLKKFIISNKSYKNYINYFFIKKFILNENLNIDKNLILNLNNNVNKKLNINVRNFKYFKKLTINYNLLNKLKRTYFKSRNVFISRNFFYLKNFLNKKNNYFFYFRRLFKFRRLKQKQRIGKIFFNKQKLRKNLLKIFFNFNKNSLLIKKLNFIKIFDKKKFQIIINNLKYLHSRVNWENLNYFTLKRKKRICNHFLKIYIRNQHRIINYYSKNLNFKYINFFLCNLKFFKNKKKFLNSNYNIFSNLKKYNLYNKNKLIIFKFLLYLNYYFSFKSNKEINNIENFKLNVFNNNKFIQKYIILNMIKNKKKQQKVFKFLNNLKLFQSLKFLKKKNSYKKIKLNSLKKKVFHKLDYEYKKSIKEKKYLNFLEKIEKKKEFFNYFFFKKKWYELSKFRFINNKSKFYFTKFFDKRSTYNNSFPGGGFVPSILDNINIIDEFRVSKIPFISLIDSNIRSVGVFIPIPSNDDSIQCINFFLYLIAKVILEKKAMNLLFFKKKLIFNKLKRSLKFKYKFIFLNYLRNNLKNKFIFFDNKENFNNYLLNILKIFILEKQINFKEKIKYNLMINHEAMYSFIDYVNINKKILIWYKI